MDIMFEVVSRQKHSAAFPTTHVFGEAGGYIGRSEDCEWVLPDRSKQISRKHALIMFDEGNFYLEDISANGVFLSLGHELVGNGKRHKIEHGEGFIIGEYTVMARLLHNPRAYNSSSVHADDDILSFSRPLSLNPLVAMDQEEEMITRQRLGEDDDLLRAPKPQSLLPADHTDPRISTLVSVVAIPEQGEVIPEDWDADPEDEDLSTVANDHLKPPLRTSSPPARQLETVPVPETDIFFKTLGFAESPATQEERSRILELAAKLLVTATTGMTHALQHRNACKKELRLPVTTTEFGISNNPLNFSPTPDAALSALLGPPAKRCFITSCSIH
ncbi:type VI secretion system-associated FHA domain protein TagH, partial [Desulfosarcina sp. OttesenSCG-928-B08]|nr:type VI secretion system-associated FHA domain protein TagH [Desulfosarcina sp. OttesenSCG-928-B08]